ncbi:MAG: acyl-CoA thioesterase [Bacteroidota bacterium]|nr:acyl-CoA thioesterase [Bacteroidota bacterium]
MKPLEKVLESKVKVRFPDCDPFNHLNNSKYLDYIINAREDQVLEFYDFDIHKLAREKGLSWVVAQNQIAYMAPATLMETVLIESQLLSCQDKNLVVEALMWNENKTVLKAIMWTMLVHVNLRTQKSEVHSEELMRLFKEVENPHKQNLSFEERVKSLRFAKQLS